MPEILIEIAYATLKQQIIMPLKVQQGTHIKQAVVQSKIQSYFPDIKLATLQVGIFGQPCSLEHPVKQGDRIEIYRPLACDPQQARRVRAKSFQKQKQLNS